MKWKLFKHIGKSISFFPFAIYFGRFFWRLVASSIFFDLLHYYLHTVAIFNIRNITIFRSLVFMQFQYVCGLIIVSFCSICIFLKPFFIWIPVGYWSPVKRRTTQKKNCIRQCNFQYKSLHSIIWREEEREREKSPLTTIGRKAGEQKIAVGRKKRECNGIERWRPKNHTEEKIVGVYFVENHKFL